MTTDLGPPWFIGGIADRLAAALAAIEAGLRVEGASHGVDEWDERRLQLALAEALRAAVAVGVEVEVPYPSTVGRPRRRQLRCDLVIAGAGEAAPPEDALWLELKVAKQRRAGGEVEPRYAEQWRRHLIADLRKLAAEPRIRAAAIVLIVFTDDEAVLTRDLERFESVMVKRGVVAGFRQVRIVPVQDRIGHRTGAIAAWPTVQD